MSKKYLCQFDFEKVPGGAKITKYDEDTVIALAVQDGNIVDALGNLLYNEITEGADVVKAKVMIIIEKEKAATITASDLRSAIGRCELLQKGIKTL